MAKHTGSSARAYLAVAAVAAAAAALAVHARARAAEAATPPIGRFVEVGGVRLHYVERGEGEPLVLLHGNGMMIQDFLASDFLALAAKHYRVIMFDRPGYGYSDRPRTTVWTPDAQADLIYAALGKIGVERYLVLGHSWGASVALALGFRYPDAVRGLVLEGGYYYPSARADAVMAAGPAIPVLGGVMRYTISPVVARLAWPAMRAQMFSPAPVATTFADFPSEMMMRPSQIRASAAEAVLMVPDAIAARGRYSELSMPIALVAGRSDKLVDTDSQARRFHYENPRTTLHVVDNCGHMVHHTAPGRVMTAVEEVDRAA
jgi:pimeloyl-ACP methyl ester carboxylesterase